MSLALVNPAGVCRLTLSRNITQLPGELYDQSANEQEQLRLEPRSVNSWLLGSSLHRYKRLRERLTNLDNQRQQRQRRLDQLRLLQRLLEPFRQPQDNVQPNLVTRDGELVRELEKMRMLVARVSGRISQSQGVNNGRGNNTSFALGSEQKLAALLDMD